MQLTVIFSLLFAVVIAIFAGLNSKVVEVNLLFIKPEMSQAIVILISAIFGAALMYLLNFVKSIKKSGEIRVLKKANTKLEQEKSDLNNKINKKNEETNEIKQNDDLEEQEKNIE
ncbi:LapA family protein [Clostridiaceae bacterium HSG29]|nr:LapA family protein [Clostridiaceae bacterium HSG29]